MRGLSFDWRWVALIMFIALLASGRSLPWPLVALALGAGGGYLLVLAWQAGGFGRGKQRGERITYWRGQRIEITESTRRSRSIGWGKLGSSIVYALIGLGLIAGAALVVLNRSGI